MKKSTDEIMNILNKNKNIEEFLSKNTDEFIYDGLDEYLAKLIKEKNLDKSTVIKDSCIDTVYAYQIFSGQRKNPSRNKILQIALAMGLDLDETRRLLKIGCVGDLYVRITRDSIIIHSINSGLSVMECNELLYELGEDLLQ